jgi:hypothetical protein
MSKARRGGDGLLAVVAAALLGIGAGAPADAELAISANDSKLKLVNGKTEVQNGATDTVTFIDLRASPPRVLAEIEAPTRVVGPPMSVAISPQQDIALVTGAIDPGDPTKQVPDDKLTVIDLSPLKPNLVARLRSAVGAGPKGASAAPKILATLQAGKGAAVAVVANLGFGSGDADTISVIDLKLGPPRLVNTYTVGQTPEGLKMSPDGKFVAVGIVNGSNKPTDLPLYNANGLLQIWGRNGIQLSKIAELPVGHLVQGHCLVEQQQDAPGAVHDRAGDHGGSLLGARRQVPAKGGRDQDQGRPGGDPHGRALM